MDIDIDLKTTFEPLDYFKLVKASMVQNEVLKKHPCGVYFQSMPQDPVTQLAAIPHKEAEDYGFSKIDFLHLSMLDDFNSKDEIRALLKVDPRWGLLLKADVVSKLFQLQNNLELLRKVKPKSIMEIADCIALIRPGKLNLIDDYLEDPIATRTPLFTIKPGDYSYKKGHAVSYAMIVVLQLHLVNAGII